MLPPIRNSDRLFVAFMLSVLSSVMTCVLVARFAEPWRLKNAASMGGILLYLLIGTFVGFLKSPFVSGLADLVKPAWRLQVIMASIAILTPLEVYIYYELLTWTFPFG